MTNNSSCSLLEVGSVTGKLCQNSKYDWHVYPKTPRKKNFFDSVESRQTFLLSIKGTDEVGIFCYHCLFSTIGEMMNDLKEQGATVDEINKWCVPTIMIERQSGDSV